VQNVSDFCDYFNNIPYFVRMARVWSSKAKNVWITNDYATCVSL